MRKLIICIFWIFLISTSSLTVSASSQCMPLETTIQYWATQDNVRYDLNGDGGAFCSDLATAILSYIARNGDSFTSSWVVNANRYDRYVIDLYGNEDLFDILSPSDTTAIKGDLLITNGLYPEFGHVCFMLSDSKDGCAVVIDQNSRDANLINGSSCYIHSVTLSDCYGIQTIIRPRYGSQTTSSNFEDVEKNSWYASAVDYVSKENFMHGVSDTCFEPEGILTREQFITVLYNMEGAPAIEFKRIYDDVTDPTAWFAKAVTWAAENNITNGIDNNLFGTGKEITREQLATLFYNYAQYKKLSTESSPEALNNFPDKVNISKWCGKGLIWAVSNQILNGKYSKNGCKILDPQGKASRAECAQLVYNYCNSQKDLANSAIEAGIGLVDAFLTSIDTKKRYMIIPKNQQNMALNVYVDDISYISDYTNICLWSKIPEDQAQWFTFERQEADTYLIRTLNHKFTINYVPSTKNIIAYSASIINNEFFKFEPIDGHYAILLQSDPSLCIAYMSDDNNVRLEKYTGSDNQFWDLKSE